MARRKVSESFLLNNLIDLSNSFITYFHIYLTSYVSVVIMFLRQLTEQNGYWSRDCKWVNLRRIQFVGACNPPTGQ